ncbi:MAG: hypothetical protein ACFFA4_16185 [Promethearchaeota archaeon]
MIKFPDKCIRCKKEGPNLKEFVYAKSIMQAKTLTSRRFKTIYLKIPICEDCKKELMKYEKIMKYLKLKYTFFCLFCSSIFLLYIWSVYNPTVSPLITTFTIILAVFSGSLSLVLVIAHILFSRKNYDRISNYIEIEMDGSISIYDPEYRKEFEESEISEEDELFNCPRCGTLLLIGMEYCHICGKKI